MCRLGGFGPRHCFSGGFKPAEATFSPQPVWRRPQTDEEIRYSEEYKRDLEQELAKVTARLRILKNLG